MFDVAKRKCPEDLKILIIFSLISVIFILIPPLNQTPLRVIFGIVLLLFIPGYAFILALFPKKDDLSGIERFTLSIGFSIAILVFDGFFITIIQWQLRPNSISISIFLITLILLIVTYFTRTRLLESEQYSFSYKDFIQSIQSNNVVNDDELFIKPEKKRQFNIRYGKKRHFFKENAVLKNRQDIVPPELEKALILGLIISIIIASGMLVYAKITDEDETFTAFYILGNNGMAENYPSTAYLGRSTIVTVGIENYEGVDVNYTLQMRLDGDVLEEMIIPVKSDDKWIGNISYIPSQIIYDRSKLEFVIFKENIFGLPYRSVHLWLSHEYSSDQLEIDMELLGSAYIPTINNSDMESDTGWKIYSTNGNVTGNYIENHIGYSSRAYVFNNEYKGTILEWGSQYHWMEQNVTSNRDGIAILSFFVMDTYSSDIESETQFKQILINGVLIWQDDVGGDEGWQHINIPVSLTTGNNTLILRFKQNGHSEVYPVEILWDNLILQPLSTISESITTDHNDFSLPTSKVLTLPEYVNSTDFTVEWNGVDIGSGISHYSIDYSKDNATWYNWLLKTENTSAMFMGSSSNTYYFRSKSMDNADNMEIEHIGFDAKTTIDVTPPTIALDISPNPSSGLTKLTVISSEPLAELECLVTPTNYNTGADSIQMVSSNGITWTGKYTVRVSSDHLVEVIGKDLVYNEETNFGTILGDITLDDFTIQVTPNPTSIGTLTIKVIPSVALKSNPSIIVKDGSSRTISLSSPTISDGEYTYTATINSATREGKGTVTVIGYTLDSTRVTGSSTFVIDITP